MFFITLIGLVLRLSFIDKPEGLWNDEYVSWMIANTPFYDGFLKAVFSQCHMPIYYLYLKIFANCSDVVLRLSSLIPGVISIWVMYYLGREYSKKTGYISAFLTSVLSFLVYYSQEVRLYSLLFLISAISLFYTVKLLKKFDYSFLWGYIISNIILILTHSLGIIYVFFNASYVLYKFKKYNNISISKYIFKSYKSKFICLFSSVIAVIVLYFILNILSHHSSSQWWGHFSYTNILFLFSDYLSPVLTNHINAPPVFFYDKSLAFWLSVPAIIGVIGIIFGFKGNKGISAVACMTLVTLFILAKLGFIVFITKYSIEILPIIILMMACGFVKLRSLGVVLLILFSLIHFAYLFTPNYVTKLPRTEGHKIVGDILNFRKPQKVIFTYYDENRFRRYTDINKITPFYISKMNRKQYVNSPELILSKINSGDKFSVVFLDSVSFVPEGLSDVQKENIPEMFLTFSKIKNVLVKKLVDSNGYEIISEDKIGSWTVITAVKN